MHLRRAKPADVDSIRQLFYDTITTVNTKDYNPEQIAIWSAGWENVAGWQQRVEEQHFFVAERAGQILGFSSITDAGYVNFMFVHKNFQGQGIASQLLEAVEEVANQLELKEIWAEVSITARPFFASKGFIITKTFVKTVGTVSFDDAIMTKYR